VSNRHAVRDGLATAREIDVLKRCDRPCSSSDVNAILTNEEQGRARHHQRQWT
jgi:hypothetical protein